MPPRTASSGGSIDLRAGPSAGFISLPAAAGSEGFVSAGVGLDGAVFAGVEAGAAGAAGVLAACPQPAPTTGAIKINKLNAERIRWLKIRIAEN
jgi:hypothetical protein